MITFFWGVGGGGGGNKMNPQKNQEMFTDRILTGLKVAQMQLHARQ